LVVFALGEESFFFNVLVFAIASVLFRALRGAYSLYKLELLISNHRLRSSSQIIDFRSVIQISALCPRTA
ncbi:MAG: hypothetical protein WA824_16105, partial [Candidatus Sulfotelmatobacter sp.]